MTEPVQQDVQAPPIPIPAAADLHRLIDDLELTMLGHPEALVELPLTHRFTDGLYIREIFMAAGTMATSRIHKTQHPYVVLRGCADVFIPETGVVERITAPHIGITQPGTRRVLIMHKDTVWATFHPNPDNLTDLGELEARLIERRELEGGRSAFELYSATMSAPEITGGRA